MDNKDYIESRLDSYLLDISFFVIAEKKPSIKYSITPTHAAITIYQFLQDKGLEAFLCRIRKLSIKVDDLIANSPRYYGVALHHMVYDLQTLKVHEQREVLTSAFKIKKTSFCCFLQQVLNHPHQKTRNARNSIIHAIYKLLIYPRRGAQPTL